MIYLYIIVSKMKKQHIITHDIIIAFRNGDEEAFEKIYNHYFNKVYFFAYSQLSNVELAKDVSQNTFISAYRSIHKLQHIEAFHSWLMRIAYCECKNTYRQNKIKSVDLPEYQDIEAFVDPKRVASEGVVEDIVLHDVINKEIGAMNSKLKHVAILKYLEGLSEEEIASVLKIPKGTVKSRVYKNKGTTSSNAEKE